MSVLISTLFLALTLFVPIFQSGSSVVAPASLVAMAVAQTPDSATAMSDAQVISGLPARAPDPRTLHEFWPVFVFFAASWIGITGYVLTFSRRMRKVADSLGGIEPGPTRDVRS